MISVCVCFSSISLKKFINSLNLTRFFPVKLVRVTGTDVIQDH